MFRENIPGTENDKPSGEDEKCLDDNCTKTMGEMREYSQKISWDSALT